MKETIPEDPRTNFAIVIKMHTKDAYKILSDPERVRDWVGAMLDKHKLEEEIDYTLTVYRTEAETDTVTERIGTLSARNKVLEEALRIACADAWPNQPQWPELYVKRAKSNIAVADAALREDRFNGPHLLTARDGSQARCAGNPVQCEFCAKETRLED